MTQDLSHQAYPKNVTVIGAQCGDKVNFMTAAWSTYLSHDPLLFGVSIAPARYTHDLIEKSGEFNCNFLPFSERKQVHAIGRISGSEANKIDELGIETSKGDSIDVPFLAKAYAMIECKLQKTVEVGDHTFFVGEIKNAKNCADSFRENSTLNIKQENPTLYLGKNTYTTTSEEEHTI